MIIGDQEWRDEQDLLYGHLPMPLNAAGEGPEMDESKVARVICWCWRGDACTVIPPS